MMVREAHCACGALSARATGDPARISVCHCLQCKRPTGMISIPADAFADKDFPPPTVDVYDERRCPWLPALHLPHE